MAARITLLDGRVFSFVGKAEEKLIENIIKWRSSPLAWSIDFYDDVTKRAYFFPMTAIASIDWTLSSDSSGGVEK